MSIWDILPWLGGGSVLAMIAVAVLAPSVLQVAGSWLSAASPLIRSAAEGIGELAKSLWAGFLDMTDNGRSILFVGLVALLAYLWGYSHGMSNTLPRSPAVSEREDPAVTRRSEPPSTRRTRRPAPRLPNRSQESDWRDSVFGGPGN